ncbi:MAG: glutamyl-tRNA reductase [Planctomycetota bacterium]
MAIIVVGINHKSASLDIRECLALSYEDMPSALHAIGNKAELNEIVIVSTCNRVEVYASVTEEPKVASKRIEKSLAELRNLDYENVKAMFYSHSGEGAVRHLFNVASSLDSLVVGETQILAQVRQSFLTAVQEDCAGKMLRPLFERSFHVAKEIHTATGIGESKVSVSSVAVDLAERIFGDLSGHNVLVTGAGETARLAMTHLRERGVRNFIITNRTFQRAAELSEEFGGEAVKFEKLAETLPTADIVLTATGASRPILDAPAFNAALKKRNYRPIYVIDIAVPRDVDPAVNRMPNVYLYDIDNLKTVVMENLSEREGKVEQAARIIEQEVEKFRAYRRQLAVGPVIKAWREAAHAVRKAEIQRLQNKLGPELSEKQKEEIEYATRRMINRLLGGAIEKLKEFSRNGSGSSYTEAVADLFGIEKDLLPSEGESEEEV